MKNETEIESTFALGVSFVNNLFSRHRVPDRERSKLVQQILNVSYHSALRRISGTIPWAIEELNLLAAYFQESLADVVIAAHPQNYQPATLVIQETKLSCVVCIEKN